MENRDPRLEGYDPHYTEYVDNSKNDFSYSWVSSSRFIWLLTVLGFIVMTVGCAAQLYSKRYKGKPNVEVPDNTKYSPKYK